MGAWADGPFDNDHAADFAYQIQDASGPEARHDICRMTFRTFMGEDERDPKSPLSDLEEGYELPSIMEEVIACAAYIDDAVRGDTRWTDTPYAKHYPSGDLEEAGIIPEFGEVPADVIADAHTALVKAVRLMQAKNIGNLWWTPADTIKQSLRQAMS